MSTNITPRYRHFFDKRNRLIATVAYALTTDGNVAFGIARASKKKQTVRVSKQNGREIAAIRLARTFGIAVEAPAKFAGFNVDNDKYTRDRLLSGYMSEKRFVDMMTTKMFRSWNSPFGKLAPKQKPVKVSAVALSTTKRRN